MFAVVVVGPAVVDADFVVVAAVVLNDEKTFA